jgi:hypothetical protein
VVASEAEIITTAINRLAAKKRASGKPLPEKAEDMLQVFLN